MISKEAIAGITPTHMSRTMDMMDTILIVDKMDIMVTILTASMDGMAGMDIIMDGIHMMTPILILITMMDTTLTVIIIMTIISHRTTPTMTCSGAITGSSGIGLTK
jgi:BioD-like phosphotransacetylase family protein